MKLKQIEKLCKEAGAIFLFDEPTVTEYVEDEEIQSTRQWMSDGEATYPMDGVSYLDEGCVCAIFDIDDKKLDKIVIQHRNELPGFISFADRLPTDQPLEEVRFRMSLGGDEQALFRSEDGALVVIRADYKKPIDNSIPVKKARVVCQACLMRTGWDTETVVTETWNRRISRTTPEKG